MRLILIVLLLLSGAVHPVLGQTPETDYRSVFSLDRLGQPRPSAGLATSFSLAYRGLMPNAAFAMARDAAGRSAWGYAGGAATPAQAEAVALDRCRGSLNGLQAECRILLRNLDVVGLDPAPAVMPLASGSLGPFRWSPLHLRRGPQAAKGMVVWAHGYAGADRDLRNAMAPGFVSILNDAGWDVLRFDRNPGDDALFTSLPRLVEGLAAVRAAGYRRLVLGGQSRGGWQAIMAASARPELVDAVIATAPAAHGEASRANNLLAGLDDFRRLLAGLPATGPRLAVVLFDGDDFDPDPAKRAAMLESLARDRRVPTLALWPQGPGGPAPGPLPIRGHGGAADWRFTNLYGACLLTLVEAP
jgi:pimeloyl-ACP methyl ester carboxylesterase